MCVVRYGYYPSDPRVRKEVVALIDNGYQVDVVCLRKTGEPRRETVDGANLHRLPLEHRRGGFSRYVLQYAGFFFLALAQVTLLHLRRRYRIVQANNMPDCLVFTALVPKLTGARVVLDVHDLMPELYAAQHGGDLDAPVPRLLRAQEKLSCSFADHVVTVTDLWRDKLADRSVDRRKCTVVMNVADERLFPRGSTRVRRNGDLREHGPSIVYHGSLIRRYGVDVAIRAIGSAMDRLPGCTLTVLGEGEQLKDLESLVRDLGLEGVVVFSKKSVGPGPVWEAIANADIGVVPHRRDSFVDEILPNKLLEYVAVGTPVITSRTRAIETYFDDTMVRFFQSGDDQDLARCILELCLRPELARSLSASADRFNDTFNWANVAVTYVSVMDRLAADG
ncbi:MAG: glycosyltransferase family 4 protein [Chloroflexi bacterium]|nr:glycosyltransferase family 4 protein [Chloroflexota bacterium]